MNKSGFKINFQYAYILQRQQIGVKKENFKRSICIFFYLFKKTCCHHNEIDIVIFLNLAFFFNFYVIESLNDIKNEYAYVTENSFKF